jgi:SAM-dependent methyltransferase
MRSLDLYVRLFEFNASLYYALKQVMAWWTGEDWSKQLGPLLQYIYLLSLPAIYYLDAKRRWNINKSSLLILTAFFVLATTVHPWYLLAVLPLAALMKPPAWPWFWVSTWSVGTYLLYVDGPYWVFVHLCWWGALAVAVWQYGDAMLLCIIKGRAWFKHRRLQRLIKVQAGNRVLDLGAGEGFVGERFSRKNGTQVMLADVIDMNRTELPHVRYDGTSLPFAADTFDLTFLVFVLHHSKHPATVVREALRVTRGTVVIWESVYERSWDRRILTWLDTLANRLRSKGKMAAQEADLSFRTAEAWAETIQSVADGLDKPVRVRRFDLGRFPHKQVILVAQIHPLLQ